MEHKPVITDSDMERLGEYFQDTASSLDPRKLSFLVWFHLSSDFCLRGAEVQSKMKKSDLLFSSDENGEERITLPKDFATKNRQGGLNGSETTTAGCITDPTQIAVIKR